MSPTKRVGCSKSFAAAQQQQALHYFCRVSVHLWGTYGTYRYRSVLHDGYTTSLYDTKRYFLVGYQVPSSDTNQLFLVSRQRGGRSTIDSRQMAEADPAAAAAPVVGGEVLFKNTHKGVSA